MEWQLSTSDSDQAGRLIRVVVQRICDVAKREISQQLGSVFGSKRTEG